MTFAKTAVFCVVSLIATAVIADNELNIRLTKAIQKVLPDAAITSVSPGPLPGVYEVTIGPSLLYVSEDGRYVLKGDVFDLDSLENITKKRRGEARIAALEDLGPDDMIEFAATNGQTLHTLYVFTDIDCGYCRKMHLEVGALNDAGITVRYLAFPRTGLESESYDKAVAVWCSADRQKALTASKAGKTIQSKACENPVKDHYLMGEAMGVRGTPAVYSDDGEAIGGYVPAKELIRRLSSTEG